LLSNRLQTDLTAKAAANDRLSEDLKKYQVMFDNAYRVLETKSKEDYETVEKLRAQFEDVVQQLEQAEDLLAKKSHDLEQSGKEVEASAAIIAELEAQLEHTILEVNKKDSEHEALQTKFAQIEESNKSKFLVFFFFFQVPFLFFSPPCSRHRAEIYCAKWKGVFFVSRGQVSIDTFPFFFPFSFFFFFFFSSPKLQSHHVTLLVARTC